MYGIEEDELEEQFAQTSREEAEIDENDAWCAFGGRSHVPTGARASWGGAANIAVGGRLTSRQKRLQAATRKSPCCTTL